MEQRFDELLEQLLDVKVLNVLYRVLDGTRRAAVIAKTGMQNGLLRHDVMGHHLGNLIKLCDVPLVRLEEHSLDVQGKNFNALKVWV